MSDETNNTAAPSSVQHSPPKYVVHAPFYSALVADDEYHACGTPEEALALAEDIASQNPGQFVDIYHHAHSVRARPPEQPE